MRSAECGVEERTTERSTLINSALRIPHSALAVKHRRLFSAPGRSEPEMPVRARRGAAAAWRAGEEALLHEERLVHLLQRARVLAHGGGDGREAHPPPLRLLDYCLQDPGVPFVQPEP